VADDGVAAEIGGQLSGTLRVELSMLMFSGGAVPPNPGTVVATKRIGVLLMLGSASRSS
jgi:hypothetical protein